MSGYPTLSEIEATASRIATYVRRTPSLAYYGPDLAERIAADTNVWLKLELFQQTGSFKPRGAVNVVMNMPDDQRARGITAFSAGNHAIAAAYAARALGISAKVVMPKTANPFRVERCRKLGAELVFADDMAGLKAEVDRLQHDEGRAMVHPFEGPRTVEGTGTVGLEFCRDVPDLDAVIVPVGGGGLIAGIASAIKQCLPDCKVYGVEPDGARGMSLSLAAGKPVTEVPLSSIADSLSAPFHTEGVFEIVRRFVDDVVTVPDAAIVDAMKLSFTDLKLAVEPAGATALAGLAGPLKERVAGLNVGLVVSGTNIDMQTYARFTGLV